MTKFLLKLAAAAVFALCAGAGALQAGDLSGDDGYGSNGYRRQPLSRFCDSNPYDERCDPQARNYKPRKDFYAGGRLCEATVRAAGKRNLFPGFARNSAVFAWQREARYVHGPRYASWNQARRASIVCDREPGALTACVAVGTPCRS